MAALSVGLSLPKKIEASHQIVKQVKENVSDKDLAYLEGLSDVLVGIESDVSHLDSVISHQSKRINDLENLIKTIEQDEEENSIADSKNKHSGVPDPGGELSKLQKENRRLEKKLKELISVKDDRDNLIVKVDEEERLKKVLREKDEKLKSENVELTEKLEELKKSNDELTKKLKRAEKDTYAAKKAEKNIKSETREKINQLESLCEEKTKQVESLEAQVLDARASVPNETENELQDAISTICKEREDLAHAVKMWHHYEFLCGEQKTLIDSLPALMDYETVPREKFLQMQMKVILFYVRELENLVLQKFDDHDETQHLVHDFHDRLRIELVTLSDENIRITEEMKELQEDNQRSKTFLTRSETPGDGTIISDEPGIAHEFLGTVESMNVNMRRKKSKKPKAVKITSMLNVHEFFNENDGKGALASDFFAGMESITNTFMTRNSRKSSKREEGKERSVK